MIVIWSLTNKIYRYILEYIIRSAVSFQSKLHIIILNYEFLSIYSAQKYNEFNRKA